MAAQHHNGEKFPGLRLTDEDREALRQKLAGERLKARIWRRIRLLQLLDEGSDLTAAGKAVGCYPREVRRVGWRYLEGGLDRALTDDPRPKPDKMWDAKQQAAIVAVACSTPPDGSARWSTASLAREVVRRGIVPSASKETIRRLFVAHKLKPWRKKNVVRRQAGPGVHRAHGGRARHTGRARQAAGARAGA